MVRTKKVETQVAEPKIRASSRKRGRNEPEEEPPIGTPSKRRNAQSSAHSGPKGLSNGQTSEYDFPSDDNNIHTDTGMKGTPRGQGKQGKRSIVVANGETEASTPKNRKEKATRFITPSKANGATANGETPRWRRNDRSAKKKSARALIERVVGGESSDEEVDEEVAREIYESSEEEEEEEEVEGVDAIPDEAATPSKRPRGRPPTKKGRGTRKKSPTPPRDLPPHELYFAQNRPGTAKTSNNTLTSLKLLTHDEYFSLLRDYKDPHEEDIEFLQSLHVESFSQWAFELSQGFSVCLYGYGSKRALLQKFASHIYSASEDHNTHKVVIVNGYVRTSSVREILGTVASAVDPSHKLPTGGATVMLDSVKSLLSSHDITITIVLNSIDAAPLRKPGIQPTLAQLAAHPQIQLACSTDTPDFTLMWNSGLRSSFNFAFHDCTTFAPFEAELEVVDDVHELLGRKARRVGGKEGVAYVLRSLPENAKNLFRLLVGEVLAAIDDEGVSGENPGVEYRMLYNKAVEEFICSSEMAFRTLLKEFHDHQMITSRKDVMGTELLSAPFCKEELEGILEDLMS